MDLENSPESPSFHHFMQSPLSIHSLRLAIAGYGLLFGIAEGATVLGVGAMESAAGSLPYVAGDGALQTSLVLVQNSGEAISTALAMTDASNAAAWLARLPTDQERSAAGSVWQSMGSDPDLIRDLLAAWQQSPDRAEVIGDGRERGRGGSDQEASLNWSDPSLAIDPAFGSGSPASAVPEPSVSLMGVLAGLGLLRRRR